MHYGELPQGYESGSACLCNDMECALRCLYALGFCTHNAVLLRGNVYSRTTLIYNGWIDREHVRHLFTADTQEQIPALFLDLCARMFKALTHKWGSESYAHVSLIDVPQDEKLFQGYVLNLHLIFNHGAGATAFTNSKNCLHGLHPYEAKFHEAWLYVYQGNLE